MNRPQDDAVLFVNSNARRGQKWFQPAVERLRAEGVQLRRAELMTSKEAMVRAVREELKRETGLIILGGGDGTFGSVDHDFAGHASTLGVLPLGTGNAFARDLGIRTRLDHACEVIANGKAVQVDLGLLGDQHFLSVATIGLSTMIARRLDRRLKRLTGPFAYLFALYQALRDIKPFDVRLELPDETAEFRSLQVVMGNGRFHAGPFLLAPDAHLTNGQLLIYALKSERRSALFRLAVAVQFGRHVDQHDVTVWRASEGRVITAEPKTVTLDGESILKTPLKFGVDRRALRVMAPHDFDENYH